MQRADFVAVGGPARWNGWYVKPIVCVLPNGQPGRGRVPVDMDSWSDLEHRRCTQLSALQEPYPFLRCICQRHPDGVWWLYGHTSLPLTIITSLVPVACD